MPTEDVPCDERSVSAGAGDNLAGAEIVVYVNVDPDDFGRAFTIAGHGRSADILI